MTNQTETTKPEACAEAGGQVERVVSHVWLIGKILSGGWMCEGAFLSEHEAAAYCAKDEFVVIARLGERLPEKVEDAECIYWPHRQTKEEGMMRLNAYRMANAKLSGAPTGASD